MIQAGLNLLLSLAVVVGWVVLWPVAVASRALGQGQYWNAWPKAW